jgi:tetratricopeptide (TPR) repeat protein
LKALALTPRSAQTSLDLGLAYFKSGDLEKAVPPLKVAAAQLPGTEQIETVLGMSLYGTGKYREAVPHLELAQSRNQDNKELRFVIAQAYLWGGQYEKQGRLFSRCSNAIVIHPKCRSC